VCPRLHTQLPYVIALAVDQAVGYVTPHVLFLAPLLVQQFVCGRSVREADVVRVIGDVVVDDILMNHVLVVEDLVAVNVACCHDRVT
jgi:hypothetical protein